MKGPKPPETRMNGINVERKCKKCGEFKSLVDFYQSASGYFGTGAKCKECISKFNFDRYNNDSEYAEKQKERGFVKRYNLSRAEFKAISKNGCSVCGSMENLGMDHDHQSDEIRGVLCNGCNTALGLLKEDSNRILKLAAYIENWTKKHAL